MIPIKDSKLGDEPLGPQEPGKSYWAARARLLDDVSGDEYDFALVVMPKAIPGELLAFSWTGGHRPRDCCLSIHQDYPGDARTRSLHIGYRGALELAEFILKRVRLSAKDPTSTHEKESNPRSVDRSQREQSGTE